MYSAVGEGSTRLSFADISTATLSNLALAQYPSVVSVEETDSGFKTLST